MCDPRGFPVDHTKLQPQRSCPGGDRLAGVCDAQLGAPEDVDHVERPGRGDGFGECPVGRYAEDVALVRIDRHALEALPDEIAEDGVRRSPPVSGRTDDRDPAGRSQQLRDAGLIEHRDRPATLLKIHECSGPVALLARQLAASRSYG